MLRRQQIQQAVGEVAVEMAAQESREVCRCLQKVNARRVWLHGR